MIPHSPRVGNGAKAPLDIHASIASPPPPPSSSRDLPPWLSDALKRRFRLQHASARLLPAMRVANCLRLPSGASVGVLYHAALGRSSYSGLQTCGSVHVCPVCAAKIAARRSVEVNQGVTNWIASGGAILLVTLTLRHTRADSLASLVDVLGSAYRRLKSGAKWQRWRDRLGIAGSITAREYTHGRHGWHPHLHALLFVRAVDIAQFAAWLSTAWPAAVAACGGSALAVAQDLRYARSPDIADYLTKLGGGSWTVGDELTKANAKKGRESLTPWDLLALASVGCADSADLWREYAAATYRRNALVWSAGLRDLVGLAPEQSDDELAAEQIEDGVILALLALDQWRVVLAADARADLLLVAASGDSAQVLAFLAGLGLSPLRE